MKNQRILLLTVLVLVSILFGILITRLMTTPEDIENRLYSEADKVLFEDGMLNQYIQYCPLASYNKLNKDNYNACTTNILEALEVERDKIIPYDLSYVFLKKDNTYISQNRYEHFGSNGLLADDIATGGKKLPIYAPDWHEEIVEWEVTEEVNKTKGNTIVFSSENKKFEVGHSKLTVGEGVYATGETVGVTLCPGDENSGITTGCHVHFTYEVYDGKAWNQAEYKTDETYNADERIETIIEEKEEKVKPLGENYLSWDSDDYRGFNTPWQILSSIHLKETGRRKVVIEKSSAGALGAMQFMPATWMGYCPELDIQNYKNSIVCADRYLQANLEAKGTWIKAIWQYNHANWYVAHILEEAQVMGLELNEHQVNFIRVNK